MTRMNSRAAAVAGLTWLAWLLAGCSNLSGLGGSSSFQCKAPEGIPCMSVSGVDANERAGTLPLLRPTAVRQAEQASAAAGRAAVDGLTVKPVPVDAAAAAVQPQSRPSRASLLPPGAIRSEPTVIRLWIAPWEDTDGDLHDQSLIYLQADSGRWLIEHNRERIRRAFGPAAAAKSELPPVDAVAGSAASPVRSAATTSSTAPRPVPPVSSLSSATQPARESMDSRTPAAGGAR